MRIRDYGYLIIIVLIIGLSSLRTFWLPPGVEPIAFWEYPLLIIIAIIVFYILNTLIEYGVLYDILRTRGLVKPRLYLIVILINLITFPPTQLTFYLAMVLLNEFLKYFYLVLEGIVIVVEWLLYRRIFKNFIMENPKNDFLSSKNILLISIVINLLSFLIIGFINLYLISLQGAFS